MNNLPSCVYLVKSTYHNILSCILTFWVRFQFICSFSPIVNNAAVNLFVQVLISLTGSLLLEQTLKNGIIGIEGLFSSS